MLTDISFFLDRFSVVGSVVILCGRNTSSLALSFVQYVGVLFAPLVISIWFLQWV